MITNVDKLPCLLSWRSYVRSLLLYLEDDIIIKKCLSLELNISRIF